ncbi:MAG: putative inorganic polyphosphate/ATP-NAD kinase [Smithella sp. PtaU1.Bin162]|nr:MAG: putative inorganic polyphosphate/ATP-NAD kinase [Smithella sp. PtaU1.Bin162]
MKIRKVGIVANAEKEKIAEYAKSLKEWLEERGIEVFVEAEIAAKIGIRGGLAWNGLAREVQLVAVLGGDGTMLRTARNVAKYNVSIVGINMGSFGYLTEVNLNEMHSALELILKGNFLTEKRMMLDVSITRGKEITATGTVLNDIVINRGNLSRIVEMETTINNKYLTTYKADGLIISTPTGSTAYSLSAGGPIVYPEKDLIIINPICPHTLTNRPIIFPEDSDLHVRVWSKGKGATVTLDGQESYQVRSGDGIAIKKSKHITKLVLSPHRSYWEILRSKLGWGGLPSGAKRRKNA